MFVAGQIGNKVGHISIEKAIFADGIEKNWPYKKRNWKANFIWRWLMGEPLTPAGEPLTPAGEPLTPAGEPLTPAELLEGSSPFRVASCDYHPMFCPVLGVVHNDLFIKLTPHDWNTVVDIRTAKNAFPYVKMDAHASRPWSMHGARPAWSGSQKRQKRTKSQKIAKSTLAYNIPDQSFLK